MSSQTQAEMSAVPGVAKIRDAETRHFVFNHTMLRIKDPLASLDFYTRMLGFTLVRKFDSEQGRFSLFFLVLVDDAGAMPDDPAARKEWLARQSGVLELTHNHGTESESGPVYHDGNSDPRGFGHLCVSVPDIKSACARLQSMGVSFQKRLDEGSMRSIAFIKDPDGYWIELIQPTPMD